METRENVFPRMSELKKEALGRLKGNYGISILSMLIVFAISMGVAAISYLIFGDSSTTETLNNVFSLFIAPILSVGLITIFYKISKEQEVSIKNVFDGFSDYPKYLILYLLQAIFVFLWTLLLIIPGIIKGIAYSMSYYIAIDNPELSAKECISSSIALMDGYKMKYFLLNLSFIGWMILGVFTCGLLYLWLIPYMNETQACFYNNLKNIKMQAQ